jgi:hypothetical protein
VPVQNATAEFGEILFDEMVASRVDLVHRMENAER